jgi:hypothetical protein
VLDDEQRYAGKKVQRKLRREWMERLSETSEYAKQMQQELERYQQEERTLKVRPSDGIACAHKVSQLCACVSTGTEMADSGTECDGSPPRCGKQDSRAGTAACHN